MTRRSRDTLGRLGSGAAHQVVVYDDAQGALAASRLWFLLRAWGHEAVAVLDGGWSALVRGRRAGGDGPDRAWPPPRRYAGSFDARSG